MCQVIIGEKKDPGVCAKHYLDGVIWAEVNCERERRRKLKLKQRAAPKKPLEKADYSKYLETPEWARIRLQIIYRDKRCVACGQKGFEVHHIHYHTLGRETGEELVFICQPCHQHEHKTYGHGTRKRKAYWKRIIAAQIKVPSI